MQSAAAGTGAATAIMINYGMQTNPVLAALLAAVTCAAAPVAGAIEPIPETPGWRGFFLVGAGYTEVESNLAAGNRLIEVGHDTIASVNDSPRSDDTFHPVFTGEVTYTFANRWQAFFGTALEDALTLDAVTQLGARRELGTAGALQAGFQFGSIPTEVWEDPYAEGVARQATDRDTQGLRLQWDRILGSAFELTLSYRDIEIDTELSGQGVTSVACDAACQALLVRDGEQIFGEVSYLMRLGANRNHLLRPSFRYTSHDLDGAAMAGESTMLQLSYVYVGSGYTVVTNVAGGSRDHDAANPIFGRKTDSDRLVADATLLYRLPGGDGRWQLVGNALWGEDDSDVDFHDSSAFSFSIGAMYRFGGR